MFFECNPFNFILTAYLLSTDSARHGGNLACEVSLREGSFAMEMPSHGISIDLNDCARKTGSV
jgi:hypothetical protein